jgi:hypothetical protein
MLRPRVHEQHNWSGPALLDERNGLNPRNSNWAT